MSCETSLLSLSAKLATTPQSRKSEGIPLVYQVLGDCTTSGFEVGFELLNGLDDSLFLGYDSSGHGSTECRDNAECLELLIFPLFGLFIELLSGLGVPTWCSGLGSPSSSRSSHGRIRKWRS